MCCVGNVTILCKYGEIHKRRRFNRGVRGGGRSIGQPKVDSSRKFLIINESIRRGRGFKKS